MQSQQTHSSSVETISSSLISYFCGIKLVLHYIPGLFTVSNGIDLTRDATRQHPIPQSSRLYPIRQRLDSPTVASVASVASVGVDKIFISVITYATPR